MNAKRAQLERTKKLIAATKKQTTKRRAKPIKTLTEHACFWLVLATYPLGMCREFFRSNKPSV